MWRLTVATRCDKHSRSIEALQWDLDHVCRTDEWEVIALPRDQRPDYLVEPLTRSTGTVVIWDRLDRVLSYKNPWGQSAQNGLLAMAEHLDAHLGMVFHRFLQGDAGRKKKRRLSIRVNGAAVDPWDPFVRDEKSTVSYDSAELKVVGDDGWGS